MYIYIHNVCVCVVIERVKKCIYLRDIYYTRTYIVCLCVFVYASSSTYNTPTYVCIYIYTIDTHSLCVCVCVCVCVCLCVCVQERVEAPRPLGQGITHGYTSTRVHQYTTCETLTTFESISVKSLSIARKSTEVSTEGVKPRKRWRSCCQRHVSIRQHTSAYVSIRQHTSVYDDSLAA